MHHPLTTIFSTVRWLHIEAISTKSVEPPPKEHPHTTRKGRRDVQSNAQLRPNASVHGMYERSLLPELHHVVAFATAARVHGPVLPSGQVVPDVVLPRSVAPKSNATGTFTPL